MIEFLKRDKALYQPPPKPVVIDVPTIQYLMVDGAGAPEGAAYQNAVGLVYAVAYTIKMSKMGPWQPPGYEDFKVPPLEGLWECGDDIGYNPENRAEWRWTTLLRMPEFVNADTLAWAVETAAKKKPALDFAPLRFAPYTEGLCVQMLHLGPYATEPETLAHMQAFMAANGYEDDIGDERRHHEVYLNDPRRVAPEKMKTVLRHPVRRA